VKPCRELCAVEFYSCVDFAVALDREAEAAAAGARRRPLRWVLFPELWSAHVKFPTENRAEYVDLSHSLTLFICVVYLAGLVTRNMGIVVGESLGAVWHC
jgi:hypothetical protein